MTGLSRRREIVAVLLAGLMLVVAAVTGTLSHAKTAATSPGMTGVAGDFHVQDAWARINPVAGRPSSAYVTIHYGGTKPDPLIAASTPIAARTELHNHVMDKGVMRMPKVASIAIGPDSETILKPGSYHLMLFDVKAPPKPGTKVPLTLSFKSGTTITLLMTAQAITAAGPDGKAGPMTMDMDHAGHH